MVTASRLGLAAQVGAGMLGVAVTVIPIAILPFSVFLKPLSEAFGWGRGDVAFALTILSLTMALAMPFAGGLIDRFGVRKPAIISLVLYAAGLAALPHLMSSFGLLGLYAGACWIGLTGSASSSIAYVKLISSRFERNRGLALGFTMSGVALGGATMPMLALKVIERADWQAAFYALAGIPLILGIPIIVGLTRAELEKRQEDRLLPTRQGEDFRTAFRSRAFIILALVFLIAATSIHGIQLHFPALLTDAGVTATISVAALSFMFIISVVTRLVAGYLFDRMFAPHVGAVCFLATGVGALALALDGTAGPALVILSAALLGIGAGAESDLLALLVSRYFGLRALGRIYGWLFAAFMAGSAIGPYLLGAAFDWFGNYAVALGACAAGLTLVALLMAMLPQFPRHDAGDAAIIDLRSRPSHGVSSPPLT